MSFKTHVTRAVAIAMTVAVAAPQAHAQLLTSFGGLNTPNTTITNFGLNNTSVGAYSAIIGGADNILMNYTGSQGLYFDYCGWGLNTNGSSCLPSVGINQAGIVRFTFGNGAVTGVGVSMNYAPGVGNVFIRALDASNGVLAEYEMSADAPISGSPFQFRGIQLTSPNIASFEVEAQGASSAIFETLSFTNTPAVTGTPEPGAFVLLGTGLIALAGLPRRRKGATID